MSPDYYRHRLTFREANRFIKGLQFRYRSMWECARLIADVQAKCAGNKRGTGIEFPWEKETVKIERCETDEDFDELEEACRRQAEIINSINKKKSNSNEHNKRT